MTVTEVRAADFDDDVDTETAIRDDFHHCGREIDDMVERADGVWEVTHLDWTLVFVEACCSPQAVTAAEKVVVDEQRTLAVFVVGVEEDRPIVDVITDLI